MHGQIYGEPNSQFSGNVKEIDVKEDGMACGNFLRVKVELDIRKQLLTGKFINLMGDRFWIPIKYEKLPWVCFNCGIMVHGT